MPVATRRPGNLPAELTSFVDRRAETIEVSERLSGPGWSRSSGSARPALAVDEPVGGSAAFTGRKPLSPLTRREREVADLVASGLSNREIAARLLISQRTAESHVEHILQKLGFTSRAQIAAWAAGE